MYFKDNTFTFEYDTAINTNDFDFLFPYCFKGQKHFILLKLYNLYKSPLRINASDRRTWVLPVGALSPRCPISQSAHCHSAELNNVFYLKNTDFLRFELPKSPYILFEVPIL